MYPRNVFGLIQEFDAACLFKTYDDASCRNTTIAHSNFAEIYLILVPENGTACVISVCFLNSCQCVGNVNMHYSSDTRFKVAPINRKEYCIKVKEKLSLHKNIFGRVTYVNFFYFAFLCENLKRSAVVRSLKLMPCSIVQSMYHVRSLIKVDNLFHAFFRTQCNSCSQRLTLTRKSAMPSLSRI